MNPAPPSTLGRRAGAAPSRAVKRRSTSSAISASSVIRMTTRATAPLDRVRENRMRAHGNLPLILGRTEIK